MNKNSSDSINNIGLIFSETPIARGYLQLFINKNLIKNKIVILDYKPPFWKFYLKIKYNLCFKNTLNFLKSSKILRFIRNIEDYFELEKDFLIKMYNFQNLLKFDNTFFSSHPNINNEKNISILKKINNQNYLNTINIKFKEVFESGRDFFHIHPGYMYKVRGADGTLNSIKYYNEIGATFFKMNNQIDKGDIIYRYKKEFKKLRFVDQAYFNDKTLYNIWYSFFDPALRVFLLNQIIEQDTPLNKFLDINKNLEVNNYYSYIDKNELKSLFEKKILSTS
jgi:hypothetical protein